MKIKYGELAQLLEKPWLFKVVHLQKQVRQKPDTQMGN